MSLLNHLTNLFKKKEDVAELPKKSAEPVDDFTPKKRTFEMAPYKKLSDEMQIELIKFISRGLTASQVRQKMHDEFQMTVDVPLIYYYRNAKHWKAERKKWRDYYREHIEEIDGSHKAFRLHRMEHVMEEATKQGDLRAVLSANTQMKEEFEMEGAEITNVYWNNPVYQQMIKMTPEQLLLKQQEATKKLMERQPKEE